MQHFRLLHHLRLMSAQNKAQKISPLSREEYISFALSLSLSFVIRFSAFVCLSLARSFSLCVKRAARTRNEKVKEMKI
jgi:hypothetical protein